MRRAWIWLPAVIAVVSIASIAGCKKKDEAVEATAPKKPPVVKRKAKPAEAPPAARAAEPAKVEAAPVAAPAAAPAAAVAVAPMPTAPTEPQVAPSAVPEAANPPQPAPEARPVIPEARPTPEAPPLPAVDAPRVVVNAEQPPVTGEPPLDVTGYIWAADLEQVLGEKAKLRRADLPGIAPSTRYNSLYFAPQKGDQFGFAVQVWRDDSLAESRTRFNTMRNTWSNVAPTNKVTDQGFRSWFGSVVSLVFADPRRPIVAAVTCSQKLCDADSLIALSQRVAERLR